MQERKIQLTLRFPRDDVRKIGYIAQTEQRTRSNEIWHAIKKAIEEFEREHGEIILTEND